MILGLCGFAGSGKDEFAKLLVQHENFQRMAFADIMRECLYALNPIVHATEDGHFFKVQTIVDSVGWDVAKRDFPDIRTLLQKFGTECGRNILGENIWVDALFNKYKSGNLVISDVRFPNEAQKIWDLNGKIIRIVRPNVEAPNDHFSEFAFKQQDFVILNDGAPEKMLDRYRAYWTN
jgi:hypothetical protein